MRKIQYLDILKKSFYASWNNKFLWLFGLIIFLGSLAENISLNENSLTGSIIVPWITSIFNHNEKQFLYFSLIVYVFTITLLVLKTISFAGLIRSLNNPGLYKQKSIISTIINEKNLFWRLLGLDLLLTIVVVVLIFLLSIPIVILLFINAKVFAVLVSMAAAVILIPLLVLIVILRKFGSIFIVLSDGSIRSSLEFSYAIFSCNIKQSLVMMLIMVCAEILYCFGFVIMCTIAVFIALSMLLTLNFFLLRLSLSVIVALIGVIVVSLLTLAASFMIVYVQAAWLSFFSLLSMQKINENEAESEKAINEGELASSEAV